MDKVKSRQPANRNC